MDFTMIPPISLKARPNRYLASANCTTCLRCHNWVFILGWRSRRSFQSLSRDPYRTGFVTKLDTLINFAKWTRSLRWSKRRKRRLRERRSSLRPRNSRLHLSTKKPAKNSITPLENSRIPSLAQILNKWCFKSSLLSILMAPQGTTIASCNLLTQRPSYTPESQLMKNLWSLPQEKRRLPRASTTRTSTSSSRDRASERWPSSTRKNTRPSLRIDSTTWRKIT